MFVAERQDAVHAAVRGVAAGKFFQCNARIGDDPGLAKACDGGGNIGFTDAISREKTGLGFKNVGCCGKAAHCQTHRGDGAARRPAGMQRLGHGAEVATQTAGHRAGNAECGLDDVGLQTPGLGQCGHAAEYAQRAGAVKAAVIVTGGDAEADLAADFDADDMRFNQGLAAQRLAFQVSQQHGDDHRTRVRRHHRQHIIKIQRMAEGAVDQCRHFSAAAFCRADNRTVAGFTTQLEVGEQMFSDLTVGAGEDRCDGVGNDFFRFLDRLIRKVRGCAAMNEFGNGFCGLGHECFSAVR